MVEMLYKWKCVEYDPESMVWCSTFTPHKRRNITQTLFHFYVWQRQTYCSCVYQVPFGQATKMMVNPAPVARTMQNKIWKQGGKKKSGNSLSCSLWLSSEKFWNLTNSKTDSSIDIVTYVTLIGSKAVLYTMQRRFGNKVGRGKSLSCSLWLIK